MKIYVDTSVVVADTIKHHVHHANAAALFQTVQQRKWTPVISTQGLAEVYAVLTGAPHKPRPTPVSIAEMFSENILPTFEIESLTRTDYLKVITECAAVGWTGRRIYDAIHIHAARKAECARIYTFNVQHFRQIAPDLLDRIMAP